MADGTLQIVNSGCVGTGTGKTEKLQFDTWKRGSIAGVDTKITRQAGIWLQQEAWDVLSFSIGFEAKHQGLKQLQGAGNQGFWGGHV